MVSLSRIKLFFQILIIIIWALKILYSRLIYSTLTALHRLYKLLNRAFSSIEYTFSFMPFLNFYLSILYVNIVMYRYLEFLFIPYMDKTDSQHILSAELQIRLSETYDLHLESYYSVNSLRKIISVQFYC